MVDEGVGKKQCFPLQKEAEVSIFAC